MRIAILHDYLNQYGGAERVLEVLLEMFPQADLYTLLYDEEKTRGAFAGKITKTSFVDTPFIRNRHRMFLPLMPFGADFLTSEKPYDLVFSSSAGYGKGINVKGKYHICYCLSPLRYAWEIDYMKNLPFAPHVLKEWIARPIAKWLRAWDKRASARVNLFAADSKYIADKVRNYYGRDAVVIYPPVDTEFFYPDELPNHKNEYYLMTGRLLYFKGFDIGIEAFNRLKRPLKIVGRGPELEKLKRLATSPYIEFIDRASDEELRILYSNAKAFIFPQIEDFGLVAAEAQACGTPVIAYSVGGGGEIVIDKKTGLLFHEQSADGLIKAVKEFETMKFDRAAIRRSADRFSEKNFKLHVRALIEQAGYSTSFS